MAEIKKEFSSQKDYDNGTIRILAHIRRASEIERDSPLILILKLY